MRKLLLGFVFAVLVVLLVVQAVGSGASAEVNADAADEESTTEISAQPTSPPPGRSSVPVDGRGSVLSGGGSMAVPK
jgi:hypothetical protein